MTQEDKHILLVDLCSRLPYGTICEDIYGNLGTLLDLAPKLNSVTLKISELGSTWTTDIDKVKPYLRPMSSMDGAEVLEYISLKESIVASDGTTYFFETDKSIDWLNENHFDYRGLIEKNLAKPLEKMKNEQ